MSVLILLLAQVLLSSLLFGITSTGIGTYIDMLPLVISGCFIPFPFPSMCVVLAAVHSLLCSSSLNTGDDGDHGENNVDVDVDVMVISNPGNDRSYCFLRFAMKQLHLPVLLLASLLCLIDLILDLRFNSRFDLFTVCYSLFEQWRRRRMWMRM